MNRTASRTTRAACLAASAVTLALSPLSAQKALYAEDFEMMRDKFKALAEAMGAETYGWQPMEGVRTVSEVFMLIAAEAYFMPSFWGADPPEGIEINNLVFGELAEVTDRAEVLEHLETALTYCSQAFTALPENRLGEVIPFFGQERTISAAIYLLLVDMHEHLGQAIAYARSNEVVPPWSAGG